MRVGGSRRVRLCSRGFCSPSSNQFSQGRDIVETPYSILKITPEGYAELPTGRLQAEKRIPAAPAQVASRPRADLPLLDVLPDVILRQVVVQRNLRMFENQQQLRLLAVNLLQFLIQLRPTRLLQKQSVEVVFQASTPLRRRRFSIGLQSLVVVPDRVPRRFVRGALVVGERDQSRDVPLHVH